MPDNPTTPPLAAADMKELRRLLDEADATEWRVTDAIGGYGDIIALVRHSFLEPVCCQHASPSGECCGNPIGKEAEAFEEKIIGSFEDDNNSRLACLAHKLAPSLLAEREAREGRIERLKQIADECFRISHEYQPSSVSSAAMQLQEMRHAIYAVYLGLSPLAEASHGK